MKRGKSLTGDAESPDSSAYRVLTGSFSTILLFGRPDPLCRKHLLGKLLTNESRKWNGQAVRWRRRIGLFQARLNPGKLGDSGR